MGDDGFDIEPLNFTSTSNPQHIQADTFAGYFPVFSGRGKSFHSLAENLMAAL
jgi:hypothetical protein